MMCEIRITFFFFIITFKQILRVWENIKSETIIIHTCTKLTVVVVRLEHSHSFIDSFDNHSAACRRRRPPGNAVSGHSSTMGLVVWWLSPQ